MKPRKGSKVTIYVSHGAGYPNGAANWFVVEPQAGAGHEGQLEQAVERLRRGGRTVIKLRVRPRWS